MCSKRTPRARIPDTRIPQLMQPCSPHLVICTYFAENTLKGWDRLRWLYYPSIIECCKEWRWPQIRGLSKPSFSSEWCFSKLQWVVSHPSDVDALAHPIDEALWLESHTLHNRLKENTANEVMFYLDEPVGVPWSPPRGGDVQVVARGGDGHLRLLVAIASSPRVGEAHGAEPWNIFRIHFFPHFFCSPSNFIHMSVARYSFKTVSC